MQAWQDEQVNPESVNLVNDELCDFDGCFRIGSRASGYCAPHHRQLMSGERVTDTPPRVARPRGAPLLRDSQGRKECLMCERWLSEDAFYFASHTSDRLFGRCRTCMRETNLLRMYGIGLADYRRLLDEQGGGCGICGAPPKERKAHGVDHDHACCPGQKSCGRCVRGVLCDPCNKGIGHLGDNPDRLLAAAAYLVRTKIGAPA